MSVEDTVKAAEVAVVNEAKKVEGEVVTEAKAVETAVVAEAEKVVAEVKKVVARARVDIETDEKLVLRDAETEFLRVQVQIRDLNAQITTLSHQAEASSKKYGDKIEQLVTKYAIDKTTMMFDNIENAFKATAQNQKIVLNK